MTLRRAGWIGVCSAALALGALADPAPYAAISDGQAPGSGFAPSAAYGASAQALHDAVEAAKIGDVARAQALQAGLADPLARRIVTWALVDNDASMLGFSTLSEALRDLDGWPHAARREAAAERAIEAAWTPPSEVIAWFSGRAPVTAEGAMALAGAYQQSGRAAEAQGLIRNWWRDHIFEADPQARMRARFGAYLTPDDDARRLSTLLYGQQGPAARAMLDLVTPDQRALGQARMALRADRGDAPQYVDLVPAALQSDPGLAFDRARYYRKRDLDVLAVGLVKNFPATLPANPEAASFIWTERRALMNAALRNGDIQSAYLAASGHGLASGADFAEAEFFAGWIALDKLRDPVLADTHFARVRAAVVAPISKARADYWRGRAAQARGDATAATGFWTEGAQYYTTFYGQLSAEKIGQRQIVLGPEPHPAESDRSAFEANDLVRAGRLLAEAGERDGLRAFVLAAEDALASPEQHALLVDMARLYGDQDLAMRVVRAAAQKGVILPERGYPMVTTPQVFGTAEPAFMLSIARQESNFDPNARSGPGALGLMQLMPSTASILARKLGVGYSARLLREPDYNLRLGGYYLGELTADFGGSYVLASAAYNAGPGRPATWIGYCGDPRGGSTDPTDFIECIPFSETRNYVMRTMETMQVYRARLNGGAAPLTLTEDLKRGSWTAASPSSAPSNTPPGGGIPYSQMSPTGLK